MQWSHHPTIRQGLAGVFKPHWQQLCRVVKLCILYLKDGKSLGNSHGCHTAPGGAQRGSAVELLGEDFAALQRSRRCSKPFEMGQLETLHFQRVERHKTEWMNRNQQWQKRSISAGYIYIPYIPVYMDHACMIWQQKHGFHGALTLLDKQGKFGMSDWNTEWFVIVFYKFFTCSTLALVTIS